MSYSKHLWIGWTRDGGFNYEITGLDSEDYKGRAEICDKFIQNLKDIQSFYSNLSKEVKDAS